jgi:oxysterol-binding protein 1
MSTYSTTSERVAKPFNPLLGETYECDRNSDMGWKLVSEQVSHHPPVLAQFCESMNGWKCSQELALSSKFYGKHITAVPKTFSRIEFSATGTSYIFNRPITSVHNLILGKLYIEHSGDVTIHGEGKAKGWKCVLTYQSSSFFSKDQRQVKGAITDPNGKLKMTLTAQWDEKMEMTVNGKSTVIWRKRAPPTDSYMYYNFTVFASQLNEMEENVAPTDSRHRPDQRLMETGEWDDSNREKIRLEELQRERRQTGQDVKPIWFEHCRDEITGETIYKYRGGYWERKYSGDWSICPKIF